jgi:hypothetical protein
MSGSTAEFSLSAVFSFSEKLYLQITHIRNGRQLLEGG